MSCGQRRRTVDNETRSLLKMKQAEIDALKILQNDLEKSLKATKASIDELETEKAKAIRNLDQMELPFSTVGSRS